MTRHVPSKRKLARQPSLRLTAAALVGLSIAGPGCDPAGREAGSDREIAGLAASASEQEQVEALERTLAIEAPYQRAERLGALLPSLDAAALPAVKEKLRRFSSRLSGAEFDLLVRFWAEREPAEALTWVARHASPLYKPAAIRTTVEIWASQDPATALRAIEAPEVVATDDTARAAQVALIHGWYRHDRESLEEYIQGKGTSVARQRAIFAYLLMLASDEGSEAVIRWAEAIPTDDARWKLAVHRQAMSALVWLDAEAATRFCDAHCEGEYGKGLRNVLIRSRLYAGDPGHEVVEWVGRVPENDEEQIERKHQSLWVAFSTWALRDRETAVAWLEAALERGEHDWLPALYGEYARQIARTSPERAIPWAEKIEDPAKRERMLVRVARSWYASDPEAAEAWLSRSDLSEAARAAARDTSKPVHLPGPVEAAAES